jgi:nucleoside-diphosphate-sugar epimerase
VVVTGSTGFLGRALISELVAQDRTVVALVRPASNRARVPVDPRIKILEYERIDGSTTIDELAAHSPDAFVHLGWEGVAGDVRDATDQLRNNLPATIGSVVLAARAGCRYWLGCGSQAEYGPSHDVLVEDSPIRPVTSYGLAKVAAGGAATAVGEAVGIATGWARVFSAYGPGDHSGSALAFAIRSMLEGEAPRLGPCTQDWDLLHVSDVASAMCAVVDHELRGAVNIASGQQRPLRDAIDLAADEIGGVRPLYGGASGVSVLPLRASVDRLVNATSWTPRVRLEQGIADLVANLRESGATGRIGATP